MLFRQGLCSLVVTRCGKLGCSLVAPFIDFLKRLVSALINVLHGLLDDVLSIFLFHDLSPADLIAFVCVILFISP